MKTLLTTAGVMSLTLGAALAGAASLGAQGPFGGGVEIAPGERCPSGMTEIRPRLCRAPEFEPPTILDYVPTSTLVTSQTHLPSARFPVVDVHGHQQALANPGVIDEVVPILDELNLRVYIAADNLSGERLQRTVDAIRTSGHADRFRVLAGIDFREVGPGWGERASRQLEEDIRAGAIGIGEIPKAFGLTVMKSDGSRLRVDEPELDPVWETAARLGVPVMIHTGEPLAFFDPIDFENERWLELALFSDRRNHGPGLISFDELMEERDNLFRRHPETLFIAAHMGWHANDLERAARLLDEFPNVYMEVGAILYELGRQPRAARDFFIRYQDRLLFGKDSFQPSEYPYFWRVFETADEYFDYYRDYHAFWKLYGMELPDEVLRKLYFENAVRLFPGLPQEGWPQ